ncbi:MAG: hypothetical protein EBU90_11150 [Proteobacteria bacterium]|jgi:hypothetical protein|nr:hypothetical protein [Pseudomonadota bacterium]
MVNRILKNGKPLKQLRDPVQLLVRTKVPEKWILIDQETGQVYQGSDRMDSYGPWVRLNVDDKVIPEDIANLLYAIIESAKSASAPEEKVI